ncbi:MAG: hypothetical protein JW894_02350 [Bacteroidales bacterium]|nr:hypothetical protein [Bacteroidales bacterium]
MGYLILKHVHSGLRWIVLLSLITAVLITFYGYHKKKEFKDIHRIYSSLVLIFSHIQALLGLILYFVSDKVVFSMNSMKTPMLRFFLLEHIILMLIAVILITVGYIKAKNNNDDSARFRKIFIYYLIGLIIIILAIPWPWQQFSAAWI